MFITGDLDTIVSNKSTKDIHSLLPNTTESVHISFKKLDHGTYFNALILPKVSELSIKWFKGTRNFS